MAAVGGAAAALRGRGPWGNPLFSGDDGGTAEGRPQRYRAALQKKTGRGGGSGAGGDNNQSLMESWDSLRSFGQNNKGRSLGSAGRDHIVHSVAGANGYGMMRGRGSSFDDDEMDGGESVHFVNIEESSSDSSGSPRSSDNDEAGLARGELPAKASQPQEEQEQEQHSRHQRQQGGGGGGRSGRRRRSGSGGNGGANMWAAGGQRFEVMDAPRPSPSSLTAARVGRDRSGHGVEDSFKGGIVAMPSAMFRIPELPRGRTFMLNILSTWGDPYYVGLMGLEIFDGSGHLIDGDRFLSIWADPRDVNELSMMANSGSGKGANRPMDPRVVENLLDGVNHTCDDLHAWLAPFTTGNNHIVCLEFDRETAVSMVRVWNYNKSRIHSYRGARYVEMTLDDRTIFKGDIKRAGTLPKRIGTSYEADKLRKDSYDLAGVEACSEVVLFTTSEASLRVIDRYDKFAVSPKPQQGGATGSEARRGSGRGGGGQAVTTTAGAMTTTLGTEASV